MQQIPRIRNSNRLSAMIPNYAAASWSETEQVEAVIGNALLGAVEMERAAIRVQTHLRGERTPENGQPVREQTCPHCGKQFIAQRHVNRTWATYCTTQCAASHGHAAKRVKNPRRGIVRQEMQRQARLAQQRKGGSTCGD